MSAKWKYETYLVTYLIAERENSKRTKRDFISDWVVQFSDGIWEGWSQILDGISNNGWEIIDVVGIQAPEGIRAGKPGGGTNGFRIFCKKPAD